MKILILKIKIFLLSLILLLGQNSPASITYNNGQFHIGKKTGIAMIGTALSCMLFYYIYSQIPDYGPASDEHDLQEKIQKNVNQRLEEFFAFPYTQNSTLDQKYIRATFVKVNDKEYLRIMFKNKEGKDEHFQFETEFLVQIRDNPFEKLIKKIT